MAYQNVFTPRFYIDYLSYWHSMGFIKSITANEESGTSMEGNIVGLNPSSNCTLLQSGLEQYVQVDIEFNTNISNRVLNNINVLGVLGHNQYRTFDDAGYTFPEIIIYAKNENNETVGYIRAEDSTLHTEKEICNFMPSMSSGDHEYTYNFLEKGWSMGKCEFAPTSIYNDEINDINKICFRLRHNRGNYGFGDLNEEILTNCLVIGHFYDMPHSPDLDLKMEIEFDGYDNVETIGGSTLTNVRYTGNPKWGELNAWDIKESDPYVKRNGRRNWNLKFSFISDKDLFPTNSNSSNFMQTTSIYQNFQDFESNKTSSGYQFIETIADHNSFISQVLNYVGNGHRFIFHPDIVNENPDQFAICILDQDSLNISQKSFKAYEFSLKIKEVW